MIVGGLILSFGSLLLLFPPKYFSAKYNFIGHQVENLNIRTTGRTSCVMFLGILEGDYRSYARFIGMYSGRMFTFVSGRSSAPSLTKFKTMYKTTGLKNSRIEVADALRGLAVIGIILYHSVEHFNLFSPNVSASLPIDGVLFNVLTVLLSGKMYGIFALLFGLSIFIMRDNQERRGKTFPSALRGGWSFCSDSD